MTLDRISFPDPYQYGTVPAGGSRRVWYLKASAGYVAFLSEVNQIDWFSDISIDFEVDGRLIDPITWTIDQTEVAPMRFSPPIIAEKWIKFTAHNSGASDREIGVHCIGELVRRA